MAKRRVNKNSRAYKRRKRRRNRRILFAVELVVLLLVAGALFVFAYMNRQMGKVNQQELDLGNVGVNEGALEASQNELKGTQLIALVGLDSRLDVAENASEDSENSDTMILACIDNDNKQIRLCSVFRDTYMNTFEYGDMTSDYFTKANAAYAYGGAEQMLTMMNKNLDLNITDYATVNFSILTQVIDLLGGLDLDMTREEAIHLNNYNVETAAASGVEYVEVEIPSEEVFDGAKTMTFHLNGSQSVSYARIRKTEGGDFRRAARQRLLIQKIFEKVKGLATDLTTLNSIFDTVCPQVTTSMQASDMWKLGLALLTYDMGEQAGFPFTHVEDQDIIDSMGSDYVVPVTLATNVTQLHNFLYPGIPYTMSETVQEYSNVISEDSGYYESDIPTTSETGEIPTYNEAEDPNMNGSAADTADYTDTVGEDYE